MIGPRLVVVLVVVVVVGGCTPPIKQYQIKDETMACDDANRLAHDTLVAMGYRITGFDPAVEGQRGTLRGEREDHANGAERQRVGVSIDCTGAGALLDAGEEGKWVGQADFKRGFLIAFVSTRQVAAQRAEMEAKMAAGTLPPSLQRRDVRVLLEPVVGPSTKLDFGFDLHAAGVLPLRVRMDNLTARTYRLDPGEIRLIRADRARLGAMSVDDATTRVTEARDAQTGRPVTLLSRGEIAGRLRQKLFETRRLVPGARAQGFLYFPVGEYTRGRVVLTEEDSGETEGVVVEF
jgi:hypothetical protein